MVTSYYLILFDLKYINNSVKCRNSSRSPPPPTSSSHHHSYTSSRRQRRSSLSPVLPTKIMVNKLTKNVKEAHLQEIFGAFGRINRIEVLIDEKWQTNRGTAYINFETRNDAERAISYMDGGQLDGNMLSCTLVPRRQPSPPPIRPITRYNSPPPFRRFTASSYRGRGRSPPRRYSRSRSRSRSPPVRRRRSYSYSSYSSHSSQSDSSRSH
ncbi:9311_t:CDS:2, partial [Entrophospora sp. SA101]